MNAPLTGRRVALFFVAGFGIVITVNFYMASLAVGGFSGVVVQNSYVASQEFNGWLKEADRQQALGWEARTTRAPTGHLEIATRGVPNGAMISGQVRRPLGQPDTRQIAFDASSDGKFVSTEPLPAGRWIIRLTITADNESWVSEAHLQ